MRSAVRRALLLAGLAWSGGYVWQALGRWSWSRRCAMSCPPFTPVELLEETRRAQEWQTPLGLAALPLVLGVAAWLLRARGRRRRRPPPPVA